MLEVAATGVVIESGGPGLWLPIAVTLHVIVAPLVALHCLRTRREAPSALLWIFVAWSLPVLGALLYLGFGVNRIRAKAWRKQQTDDELRETRRTIVEADSPALIYWKAVHTAPLPEPEEPTARDLETALSGLLPDYPLLGGNGFRILVDGDEAYPPMLAAIREARHHIHLQSFIIGNDEVGRDFLEAMAERARAGVKVRVLYDRFGSTRAVFGGLFRPYRHIPNLHLVGWTQANPIKRQFQVNLRNHRKALIVDGTVAFTGGLNLAASNRSAPGRPAIRDYHFLLRGPIVQELQYTFLRDWYFMTDEPADDLLRAEHFPNVPPGGTARVRVINSGPTNTENGVVGEAFFAAIVSARRQIVALTPYFVPPVDLIQALRSAARRRVEVKLVLPRRSNHAYAGLAARALYEELMEAGVRIFEREPPFLHAKALVVDGVLALVGTANLDERSLRLNYETHLAVHDQDFAYNLSILIAGELARSQEIDLAAWRRRPHRQKLLENFCSLLTPVL